MHTETSSFISEDEEEGHQSERFLSVLDIRRQMAKIKDSLKSTVVVDQESDDIELFSEAKIERSDNAVELDFQNAPHFPVKILF